MSVILCRQEPVHHPYYFDNLGVHLYSSQELCYVIYHHPLLVMDHFIDEHLIEFIRDELDMGFLALKLERWLKSGEDPDEALLMILQETYYYPGAEQSKFRQQLAAYRKLSPVDFEKAKADYLFGQKQYGKAIVCYDKVIAGYGGKNADEAFLAKIWHNLGSSYARMFLFDKAFHAYQKSYDLVRSSEVLQNIYTISVWSPSLVLKDRYQSIITEEVKEEWDQAIQAAEEHAQGAESLKMLEELFQKDPVRRAAGVGELVQRWKQEYRNMI